LLLRESDGPGKSRQERLNPGPDIVAKVIEHERCEACGFDGGRLDDAALLEAIRELAPQWRALISSAGDELRVRPDEGVWSALEYAAHSRDITALHVAGVELALTGEEPTLPPFADDAVDAAAVGYAELDPGEVVDALEDAANRLAGAAETAGPDTWTRGLTIGEARNDVRRMLEHSLHDSVHHLDDVERGLDTLRGSPGEN